MSSLSLRTVLACDLLTVFVTGCAHRSTTSQVPRDATTVTAEDIERAPGDPIEKVLMSKSPGVQISRTPDGGLAVRIRGTTSISGSNAPLYVIDGVPIEPGPYGSLLGINPYDIETIQVLKDATSTAMYGMRGANGVIVIKTKRAR